MTSAQMNSVGNAHIVELISPENSRITSVCLYLRRAEITRSFKVSLKAGQNQVVITRLPRVLVQDSLRVEGRGKATIQDVSVSRIPQLQAQETESSVLLTSLNRDKKRAEHALSRCSKALSAVECYIESLSIDKLELSQLGDAAAAYDSTAEKLDEKIMDLEAKLEVIENEIGAEEARLKDSMSSYEHLKMKVSIGVSAEVEGEVELILKYAVTAASWAASYDLRVDTQAKDRPVRLVYKACITQNTGEAWNDVPLTLETVVPTFGTHVPTLHSWRITYDPSIRPAKRRFSERLRESDQIMKKRSRFLDMEAEIEEEEDLDLIEEDDEDVDLISMDHRESRVSSTGHASTFKIPGLTSIPCDGEPHNVTISQLGLDASIIWLSVPKVDPAVHLKAKIENSSEYHLLSGNANIYVDGTFVSRSHIGPYSPHETFNCSLGLDPSIRITYTPLSKTTSQSGSLFTTKKMNTYTYSQRVTIHNTKSIAIPQERLHILDHIPVSTNTLVTVKLINPALVIRDLPGGHTATAVDLDMPSPVPVSDGVLAQWAGADEPGTDVSALGKDGKFVWLCEVPPLSKLNLNLQWEVLVPVNEGMEIYGL